ncbi:MAG: class I SAM-dependent methyltransferase [Alphaproteobacteria bacterium]|nr:class I SAM-dependent methyltransferase [Alphaproteobacteria bacterium]
MEERLRQGLSIELDYPCLPRVRSWDIQGRNRYRELLASGEDRYRVHLASFLDLKSAFTKIPVAEPPDERSPYWTNGWFPALDAICLSGLVAKLNPRCYVEVGSGNSTKFVRRAIADHGLRTRVISIDPHPRAVIDELCDEVIRDRLENCDLKIFANLGPEDLVFIDNSHRSFQGSDVTVFFTEILPLLKSGCHYGVHDIFLPYDYPEQWLPRYYSEQYLLMSYLLGGAGGDEIVLPVHYVERTPRVLATLDPLIHDPALKGAEAIGGAFWMRRR